MSQSKNPLEHSHSHMGHNHDTETDVTRVDVDPAQQSLADALQVSFRILKIVMLALLVLYLFSNVFNVRSQEVAIRLRFGAQVGPVLQPGGPYFALPYPIEEVIRIPTTPTPLTLNRQFWFELTDADAGKTTSELTESRMGPLNPEKDGSLITGDANVVHARWKLSYFLKRASESDPVSEAAAKAYLTNVGDTAIANAVVRNAAEEAIVSVMATTTADDVFKSAVRTQEIESQINAILDRMETGLQVAPRTLSLNDQTVPLSTREAFQAVLTAENQKGQQIEAAQQERARILGETVGEAHGPLLTLIEKVEAVSEVGGDREQIAPLQAELDLALRELKIANIPIGGRVSEVINDAQTYRTSIVEQVKGEAEMFQQLLADYQRNPQIITTRLWQEARQRILGGENVETFFVSNGQIWLDMNRDPAVKRDREKRRLAAEQEERLMNRPQR